MSGAKNEITVADVVLKGNVFSKQAVEGILADVIVQIKSSLDVVMGLTYDAKISKVDNIKSTFLITRNEVESALKMLSAYSNASLSPKHRYARALLSTFLNSLDERSSAISKVRGANSKVLADFGLDLVDFLTSYHRVLHDSTADNHRRNITQEFCGYVPLANGEILQ